MSEIAKKNKDRTYRLTNATFKFPKEIKDHFYTANYFIKTMKIAEQHLADTVVTMQFFQRKDDVMVCGVDEAIAILQEFAKNPENLIVEACHDGDIINANEPVLKITGLYKDFAYLESLIDGILTRRTNTAHNTRLVLEAAYPAEVFSMADRQDDYLTQAGDGYASYIAGIRKFSTDAQGKWIDLKGTGTMPHALIAMTGGDLIKACEIYSETFPDEKISALVDYHNDTVNEALKVARHFGRKLGAIRLDTSKALLDEYFARQGLNDPHLKGVTPELVFAVREALDAEGFHYVKIVVSSSFDPAKIRYFKEKKAPVDLYGVGSFIVNNKEIGFTGDVVKVNDKAEAKVGRHEYFSDKLVTVKLQKRA